MGHQGFEHGGQRIKRGFPILDRAPGKHVAQMAPQDRQLGHRQHLIEALAHIVQQGVVFGVQQGRRTMATAVEACL